jgi:hypothetical protein
VSDELSEAQCASFIDHRLRDLQDEHGDEQLPKATYQDVIAEVRQQFSQDEMQEAFKILIAWARYDAAANAGSQRNGVNDRR